MKIYIEKKELQNPILPHILTKFPQAQILKIDHYKNLFDKTLAGKIQKSVIFASVNNALLEIPENYGFDGKGFFLKNSLNCIYDCSYCYLKGAFKNDTQVFFINYDDIKQQIKKKLVSIGKTQYPVWFYASDYSDNLATNDISQFVETFVPFFETLPNAMMEIRTKSTNIKSLLSLKDIQNTEIAFSLSPQEIITKYEHKTPKLEARIEAVNTLLDAGWKVGVRFLPLLPVKDYQEIYARFIKEITKKIDFSKVHSVFLGGLMYTYEDYSKILKKNPSLDILYKLEKNGDGFVRGKEEMRKYLYTLFEESLPQRKCRICLDSNDEKKEDI